MVATQTASRNAQAARQIKQNRRGASRLNVGDGKRNAIIKITLTAICGSELHLYNGYIPSMRKGDILGHEFTYNPVAGALGHAVASIFGANPKSQMNQDLMRMKSMIETGVPPHDAPLKDETVTYTH